MRAEIPGQIRSTAHGAVQYSINSMLLIQTVTVTILTSWHDGTTQKIIIKNNTYSTGRNPCLNTDMTYKSKNLWIFHIWYMGCVFCKHKYYPRLCFPRTIKYIWYTEPCFELTKTMFQNGFTYISEIPNTNITPYAHPAPFLSARVHTYLSLSHRVWRNVVYSYLNSGLEQAWDIQGIYLRTETLIK